VAIAAHHQQVGIEVERTRQQQLAKELGLILALAVPQGLDVPELEETVEVEAINNGLFLVAAAPRHDVHALGALEQRHCGADCPGGLARGLPSDGDVLPDRGRGAGPQQLGERCFHGPELPIERRSFQFRHHRDRSVDPHQWLLRYRANNGEMEPLWRRKSVWITAIVLGLLFLWTFVPQVQRIEVLPYSEFVRELDNGNVRELQVYADHLEGELARPLANGHSRFVTVRVEPDFARELGQHGVRFSGVPQTSFWQSLLSWVPLALMIVIWLAAARGIGGKGGAGGGLGGLLSMGRSRARIFVETGVKVTFDDVAGVDEAKAELEEVVAFLKDPKGHSRLGARMPKGILLVGPPGTGKTLLARAVAGQAGVPFFSINGSEFVEMFVGVGAARVRDLFEQARQRAPAIIFIDEIDALGRARGAWSTGGQDEKEQTLNQLLAELDGFDPTAGVVLLAATNRPEILDPALLRAGRFDRQVLLDRPDRRGRVQILGVHLKRIKLGADVNPDQIAALTPGFSGADIANMVNEAALLATRRDAQEVSLADFTNAIERIVAGLEKRNRILNATERRIIAVHEMGHALVALTLPGQDKVHKVSIIPRGIGALGYTIQRPTEDRYLMTRPELENKMAMLLGGRAAESLLLGEVSTGAEDDLARATDIARSMVMRFGMDSSLGHVAYERGPSALLPLPDALALTRQESRSYSEATARDIDNAVKALLDAAFTHATALLAGRRALLEEGSRQLLAHETLDEGELQQLLATDPASLTRIKADAVAAA
jgi:cell division protease FtsH